MPWQSHKVSRDSGDPPAQPTRVELPPDIRDELLDPAIWQEGLETYALTTKLAVALTDVEGRLIGKYINPQPTWSLLHANKPEALGGCPFLLASPKPCTCVADALAKGGPVFTRGRVGFVHFAVPLILGGHKLGALIAGQVFDQYPEQLPLNQIARKFDLSPQEVWQKARLEHPVKRATLKIYGNLLATLGNTFLQNRYHTIIEASRLAEMTQLRDQALAARAEAETANQMKDNFLATVSHELRTPLNAIFGWIQLMSNRTLDEATFARAVETIARNARSQAKIIDDLMDISRIITGKLQLDVQSVELVPIIEAAIDAVNLAADVKSIRLQTTLDPQAGPVLGDPNRLQQVIWNLLFNAIKFTPSRGSVEIGLKRAESQVVITVSDTGQGISEELLPYVFDRFRQADSTSARRHGGLGVGLSIVRQLVAMHGGNVHADSPGEGQGATFTVTLPVMAARIQAGDSYPISLADLDEMPLGSAPALDGLRVLVVDDEADAREIFRLMLTQCGAEVRMSASAAEALESLEQWRPDVLVSDIGMAGEDGYELMKKMRALEPDHGGQTPAVALTGYANVEDQKRALAAGYQMHMPKPVALVDLATAVAILAGRAGMD